MTRAQADEILHYVAESLISPLSHDERPAKEAWSELTSEPFSKLVAMVNKCVDETNIKDDLKVISFESVCSTSSGQPVVGTERKHNLLFNKRSISEDQVRHLIEMDMYDYDSRVIDATDEQLKYLRARES